MNFKRILLSLLFLMVTFIFVGCATILSGTIQKVNINSKPDSAVIKVYDMNNQIIAEGLTPYHIDLKKGAGFFTPAKYKVEISKDGYLKKDIYISGNLNAGWYLIGNFFIGGLIGWIIVDPLTGAMWNLSPENINTELQQGTSLNGNNNTITIVLIDQVPNELMEKAIRIN